MCIFSPSRQGKPFDLKIGGVNFADNSILLAVLNLVTGIISTIIPHFLLRKFRKWLLPLKLSFTYAK